MIKPFAAGVNIYLDKVVYRKLFDLFLFIPVLSYMRNWMNLTSNSLSQNLIMQHVDHSAGDLIDLLQGLLRYDPAERLKAREALRHPFFVRDPRRCGYPL